MKTLKIALIALSCIFSNFALAEGELRGIDMILDGRNGEAPNENSTKYIYKMIARWAENMYLAKLVQYEAPTAAKGAFHICVEPTVPTGQNAIYADLNSFSPGSTVRWELTEVESCALPTAGTMGIK